MSYGKVNCWYCEYFRYKYTPDEVCFIEANIGFCEKKQCEHSGVSDICSEFKLRSGLYTLKWYPGKEEGKFF